jgi:hemerythrin-like domain-containing protein
MKATEVLMEEHRQIERVLNALEKAAGRLSHGEEVYPRFFSGAAFFTKRFSDRCHHNKEEAVLFPALVENGLPKETGPVAVLLFEHAESRRLNLEMWETIERFQAGDERARDKVIQSTLGYIKLLRQHIYKEDKMLFSMADKVIPANQQEQIYDFLSRKEFDEMGDELHEKFFGMAERLEKECFR